MTFASMTGFAESAGSHEGLRWRWEAKSVNSRSLDMRLRTPPGYDGLEAPARRLAGERFQRGAFQISLTIEPQESMRGLVVDAAALASAVKIAREIAAETGLAPARVDVLLALKGVIVADEGAVVQDPMARAQRDAAILESLANAFDRLAKERCGEGAKLAVLLASQIGEVERLVAEAGRLAAAQPAALRARLTAQVKELLDAGSVSEERLAQEVALLAVKADVREELDRLTAHVQDARALIAQGKGVGRKLDFLAQEFNREANTLCSKSTDIALTRTGLALKAVIDQFREQSQNVE
ncbi:MAG TPA: YicC/YloC family endoribonuclease [Rhizomicrobium sp.]|nr:YicC/YloC family endoribonuclease [Rhizomicrobium sp.]